MNDTELLDDLLKILENHAGRIDFDTIAVGRNNGLTKKEVDELVTWVKKERTEEQLNEKIRQEVKKQLGKRH
jgi:hypothetical protein